LIAWSHVDDGFLIARRDAHNQEISTDMEEVGIGWKMDMALEKDAKIRRVPAVLQHDMNVMDMRLNGGAIEYTLDAGKAVVLGVGRTSPYMHFNGGRRSAGGGV
jgi:hypothetical protein